MLVVSPQPRLWLLSARRAELPEPRGPTEIPPEPLGPFAPGFHADVSHLEALLTLPFRLEVHTGWGRDSQDGLFMP